MGVGAPESVGSVEPCEFSDFTELVRGSPVRTNTTYMLEDAAQASPPKGNSDRYSPQKFLQTPLPATRPITENYIPA